MLRRYRTLKAPQVVALAALGTLMVAACGTDDSTAGADTTVVATTTEAPVETSPATTAAVTTAEAPTTTEAVPEPEDRPVIVATTTIWGDVASNVVCHEYAEVVVLIPAGADSHAFEPSLADRGTLGDADLVVMNGLDLEEGLVATIDAVASDGVPVFGVADSMLDLLEFGDGDDDSGDDDDHGHSHSHGGDDDDDHDHEDDPHVWFDPVRVADILPALGEAIVAATDLDAEAVTTCVEAYRAELLAAHDDLVETFSVIADENRLLVTNHDSLGYLADRYDFEIIGTAIPGTSTLAETNPADLEDLARTIRDAGVPAVFAEIEASSAELDAVADRLGGVTVVALLTESLGEPGGGADTYVGFLRTNAELIADALGG